MKYLFLIAGLVLSQYILAQNDNLLGEYNFDKCTSANALSNYPGVETGTFNCICGYQGQAYEFTGTQTLQLGPDNSGLDNVMTDNEFTFAAAILSAGTNGPMTVLSVQPDCASKGYQLIYDPSRMMFTMNFMSVAPEVISFPADAGSCWQYIAFTRSLNSFIFYLNGKEVYQYLFKVNPDLRSDTNPLVGNANCSNGASPFKGIIDQVRIYTRLIGKDRAIALTGSKTNRLTDHFQVVFPGKPYGVAFEANCPGTVTWIPAAGVSDPTATQVELTTDMTTRYTIAYNYGGCTQSDTILLKVQDPSSLNCGNLLLPNAFTPNGDNLNDTYGISTVLLAEGDVFFEIFDMHGARVFSSTNADEKWDGKLYGKDAPPGVYLYKIKYTCNNEKYSTAGSVNLIR